MKKIMRSKDHGFKAMQKQVSENVEINYNII
jgi:hypothetical protein